MSSNYRPQSKYGGYHDERENQKWWSGKDAARLVSNTKKDWDRRAAEDYDPWVRNDRGRGSGDRWYDSPQRSGGEAYGRAASYKSKGSEGPYRRSDQPADWETGSNTSKTSSRSTVKMPRHARGSVGRAQSEPDYEWIDPAGEDRGDGEERRSRATRKSGGGSSNRKDRDRKAGWNEKMADSGSDDPEGDRWAQSPEAPSGDQYKYGRDQREHWRNNWGQAPKRSEFMRAATEDTFLSTWYQNVSKALGSDFDPEAGHIPTFWGGAGAAEAIEGCFEEAAAQEKPDRLSYICSCCSETTPHKGDLAQMLVDLGEARQAMLDSPHLVPSCWTGKPPKDADIGDYPELAPCGWPTAVIQQITWRKFSPEAKSVRRAIEHEQVPDISTYRLGNWRHSYVSDFGPNDCLVGICRKCYEERMKPARPFTKNTWNKFAQNTRFSERDLKKSIYAMTLNEVRKNNPKAKLLNFQSADVNALAKEIAEKCKLEDLVALAQAADWSPRVADNMFMLYTCHVCRKACVNQGGWWVTSTKEGGKRCFRCPFCGAAYIYSIGAELRLVALNFFDTPSSAFIAYLGAIPQKLDNDLRYVKMALLYNKLGDRSLSHLVMVIDEMNVDAVQWFQKMKLGKIGVSCNVHDKLREEYRDGVESVLMTDHRLMCDVAGKEFSANWAGQGTLRF